MMNDKTIWQDEEDITGHRTSHNGNQNGEGGLNQPDAPSRHPSWCTTSPDRKLPQNGCGQNTLFDKQKNE